MLGLQVREANAPRILITEPIAQEGIDLLRYELPEAHIDVRLDLSQEHLMALIGTYTILIVRSQTRVTEEVLTALRRHASGDWGDLCPEDALANDTALHQGGRLFSTYGQGHERFWIVTAADRSVTTVSLPEDD